MQNSSTIYTTNTILRDMISGMVVFLVAMPLCLGIALASGATPFAGLIAGIVGGIVVGLASGSHTSVSGPAAGLTAILATQIESLGEFRVFLLAVCIAGAIQIVLGVTRAGFLSSFVPTSVIKGLLAAIGIILILKQLPHVFGHDVLPEGVIAFEHHDQNTFTELFAVLKGEVHLGALVVGVASVCVLLLWDRIKPLKNSIVPSALVVVVLGTVLQWLFRPWGEAWSIQGMHLVQVPVAESMQQFATLFEHPDFSNWNNPAVYRTGALIAAVASLETLINLEAVDRIDPRKRISPPNRELVAQGLGNITSGLLGGIPVTSVIVRSSVNLDAGSRTRLSAIVHGVLILVFVAWLPWVLNLIPISCLAAILMVTGLKLASPTLFTQMWKEGRYQFVPFILTLVGIVFSDLIYGVLIGLAASVLFILNSSYRRPVRRRIDKHISGEVLHVELANQVSFLNRAALESVLHGLEQGQHVLLDATHTDYIDPDILGLIKEYKSEIAPIRGVQVSLSGFREKYQLQDEIGFVDYSTRELQERLTPAQVLQFLKEGNQRFQEGKRLYRDLDKQMEASGKGQNPLAVILSCIDSRSPAEIIFDLGLGDIFSVRVAGNVMGSKVLGSIEYGVAVAQAKLIVVLGHTQCGAVTTSVDLALSDKHISDVTSCEHLGGIIADVQKSIDVPTWQALSLIDPQEKTRFTDHVARINVTRTVEGIIGSSGTISRLVAEEQIAVIGAMYDVASGEVQFLH